MANRLTAGAQIFEDNAQDYDAWFDTDKGQALFALELACLKSIKPDNEQPNNGQWLEVGVGSGRFAQALGIQLGVDPAPEMIKLAKAHGISAVVGYGENLPYPDASMDGVLMVCTICFVGDASKVFSECARVLKPRGHLLIGFVPLDSVWGQYHSLRGKAGHTYYADARFFYEAELIELAAKTGLSLKQTTGCELPAPKAEPADYPDGMNPTHGVQSFRAVLFGKNEAMV